MNKNNVYKQAEHCGYTLQDECGECPEEANNEV